MRTFVQLFDSKAAAAVEEETTTLGFGFNGPLIASNVPSPICSLSVFQFVVLSLSRERDANSDR